MMRNFILQASPGFDMSQLILFLMIGLVIYFFMIRPQQKKQKDQKKYIEELKKGDQVVTIGGMHGKVTAIEDDTVILEVDRGSKLKFEKSAVSMEISKKANKQS
jgi:preprotein translocase subunit YajC